MSNTKISTISVHELKKRKDINPSLCVIDVRELDEWQAIHIPGTIHIPKDELVHTITSKVPLQEEPIYLHCRGGIRSMYAADCLIELGYKEVYSIDGGIMAWETAGYPVER